MTAHTQHVFPSERSPRSLGLAKPVTELRGRWDVAGLQVLATRLQAAGINFVAWHFFGDDQVVMLVRSPADERRAQELQRIVAAVGLSGPPDGARTAPNVPVTRIRASAHVDRVPAGPGGRRAEVRTLRADGGA